MGGGSTIWRAVGRWVGSELGKEVNNIKSKKEGKSLRMISKGSLSLCACGWFPYEREEEGGGGGGGASRLVGWAGGEGSRKHVEKRAPPWPTNNASQGYRCCVAHLVSFVSLGPSVFLLYAFHLAPVKEPKPAKNCMQALHTADMLPTAPHRTAPHRNAPYADPVATPLSCLPHPESLHSRLGGPCPFTPSPAVPGPS